VDGHVEDGEKGLNGKGTNTFLGEERNSGNPARKIGGVQKIKGRKDG